MATFGRNLKELQKQLTPTERKALQHGIKTFRRSHRAMVPVSQFEVVATGLFDNGKIAVGHNDEQGMTHGTIHGEDSMLHHARFAFNSRKPPKLKTIFVVAHALQKGNPAEGLVTPCALCRGKLRFTHPDSKIVTYNPHSQEYWITTVKEALKHPSEGTLVTKVSPELQRIALRAKNAFKKARTTFDHPEGIAIETQNGSIFSAHNFESAAFTSSAAAGQRLLEIDPEKDVIKRIWIRTTDPNGAHPFTLQAILDHLGGSTAEIYEEIVTKGRRTTYRTKMNEKVANAFSKDSFAK